MDDLITWLRAQLDEIEFSDWHERTCQTHQKMSPGSPLGLAGSPLSCNCRVPDFVLRDVEAKRRLIELHKHEVRKISQAPFDPMTGERRPDEYEVTCEVCGWSSDDPTSACETLRLLALPFSDRPGYREEWKP